MINYKLKIECQGEKTVSSDITFVSGDVGAYKLTMDFFDNEEKLDLSKYMLLVRTKRADGKCFDGLGKIENGQGVYIPKSNIYAVPGELIMEIALCDSAKNYVTAKIIVAEVIEGIGEKTQPESDEVSIFVTLMSQTQAKLEELNNLIESSIPQKGVDYYTEEDKEEMVQAVLDALPDGNEVAY